MVVETARVRRTLGAGARSAGRSTWTGWRRRRRRASGMLFYSTYILFLTGYAVPVDRAERRVGPRLSRPRTRSSRIASTSSRSNGALRLRLEPGARHVLPGRACCSSWRRCGRSIAASGCRMRRCCWSTCCRPWRAGGLLSIGRVTSTLFPAFLWLAAVVPARHRARLGSRLRAACRASRRCCSSPGGRSTDPPAAGLQRV